jgi:ABC-type phosphate transport system permease subunit
VSAPSYNFGTIKWFILRLWILESIVMPAWPAIQKTGLSFFTSTVWDVNRDRYGALPFLIGTTVSSLIALCMALPLGVLRKSAPRGTGLPNGHTGGSVSS